MQLLQLNNEQAEQLKLSMIGGIRKEKKVVLN